jgi:hypothetical protein
MADVKLNTETWEDFNAEALFPPPQLHANHITKVDKKKMTKVDAPEENLGGDSNNSDAQEPQEGDTYCDSPVDKNHVDEMFEMEGLDGGSPDEREVRADKEIDERTQQQEQSGQEDESDFSAGKEQSPQEKKSAQDSGNKEEQSSEEAAEPTEQEGAEKPIQKESEGVEEVAEATSKTSEDVHGGDEATKDIEDSPNAANDGQNLDNKGAETGEGGDEGEGGGEGETSGGGSEQGSQAESESSQNASVSDQEDWEGRADASAFSQRLYDQLAEVGKVRPASTAGGGEGVDYSGETWDEASLRTIFFKTRELISKLMGEEDFTRKQDGGSRWWVKELVNEAVSFRHHRIPSTKFDRPKENNIVFFVDVSGSVSTLAELFMALMGGAAGLPNVKIVVGSEAHAENEIAINRPFKSVEKAIDFFRHSVNAHVCDDPLCTSCKGKIRNVGWTRPYEHSFEPGVVEYLREHNLLNSNTTCVFFGDMQGVHFKVSNLRKLVRTCKCLWLFTDEPDHFTHTGDLPMAVEAGMPIIYNVRSAKTFAKAVRRFQSIKPKMKAVL